MLATWIAGAGASGVLSARGGDALRILLMRRHMTTTCPRLIGTLAAETVAETVLGALLTVWALSAGLVPGLHRPGLATAALIGAGAIVRRARRAPRRPPLPGRRPRLHRRPRAASPCSAARAVTRAASPRGACSAARCGSARSPASSPPSRCPVSLTAALVVMVAHSSGRLLPFSPASAATSLGLLVAAFPAVTHTTTGAGQLTAFYLGSTGLLTVVGLVALRALLVARARPRRRAHRGRARRSSACAAAQGARARPRRLGRRR